MSNEIDDVLDLLKPLFTATDEVLSEWNGTGNLQFPILLGSLAAKLNWDEKQVRENDPLVRFYIRHHKDWHVTRGAHGGIMKMSEKQKKEAVKAAKESVKKQIQSAIESGAAGISAPSSTTDVSDSTDDSSEEDSE
jgi:hypothetical protein